MAKDRELSRVDRFKRSLLDVAAGCPASEAIRRWNLEEENDNPWRDAVHDAMIINENFPDECEDDAQKAVAHLIKTEADMALDPSISKAANHLIEAGRNEGRMERLHLADQVEFLKKSRDYYKAMLDPYDKEIGVLLRKNTAYLGEVKGLRKEHDEAHAANDLLLKERGELKAEIEALTPKSPPCVGHLRCKCWDCNSKRCF